MNKYNDGILQLFEDIDTRTNFGAKKNEANLKKVCKLNFEELSSRQQDQEFADQQGFSLSLKVRCPLPGRLVKRNTKYKAIIESDLYDVSYFDLTRDEIFLYLEYVRSVKNDA